jgi:hypothetical protein
MAIIPLPGFYHESTGRVSIYFVSSTPNMDPSQYAIFLIKCEKKEIPTFLMVTFAVHHQRATNANKSQNEIIRF